MALYSEFIRLDISDAMRSEARYHAGRRTRTIVRRFNAGSAPLSDMERNYVGALGEILVKSYFSQSIDLTDNYDTGHPDSGDIQINERIFDIKSEAVPMVFFKKLYEANLKPYEPYGCRVYTVSHLRHLKKYTGGVIFTAFPAPDDAKQERHDGELREEMVSYMHPGLILGYVKPEDFTAKTAQKYSPPHPVTGRRLRYNSANIIFTLNELRPVKELCTDER